MFDDLLDAITIRERNELVAAHAIKIPSKAKRKRVVSDEEKVGKRFRSWLRALSTWFAPGEHELNNC
jgi:hypothetical protein